VPCAFTSEERRRPLAAAGAPLFPGADDKGRPPAPPPVHYPDEYERSGAGGVLAPRCPAACPCRAPPVCSPGPRSKVDGVTHRRL